MGTDSPYSETLSQNKTELISALIPSFIVQ